MFSTVAGMVALVLLALPVYFSLLWVHRGSRRRAFFATDNLVVAGLLRERKEGEYEITLEAFQDKLKAVRECERRVYGRITGQGARPASDMAVMDAQQARVSLGKLFEYVETVDESTEKRLAELEQRIDAKRADIQSLNRRLRVMDRALAISSGIVLVWLTTLVLYLLVDLALLLF